MLRMVFSQWLNIRNSGRNRRRETTFFVNHFGFSVFWCDIEMCAFTKWVANKSHVVRLLVIIRNIFFVIFALLDVTKSMPAHKMSQSFIFFFVAINYRWDQIAKRRKCAGYYVSRWAQSQLPASSWRLNFSISMENTLRQTHTHTQNTLLSSQRNEAIKWNYNANWSK